jgi:hypothetical protein
MTQPIHQTKKRVADGKGKMSAQGETPVKLLVAMTGKASAAKTAPGDEPVFAYIASLPQPQRGIADRIDGLAARSLPGVQRAVKWGMAYYGVNTEGRFRSATERAAFTSEVTDSITKRVAKDHNESAPGGSAASPSGRGSPLAQQPDSAPHAPREGTKGSRSG